MKWRWKDEDKIFEIGNKFIIAPPWTDTKKLKITFTEGESFGTGVHETTISCIEIMETLNLNQKTVLDIGIGSGVLSIAALKLNAKRAVGFDIAENAIDECRENARLNNVKNLDCFTADSPKDIQGTFDIIFANIFFDIILSMKNDINRLIKDSGYLLLSGVVWEEAYTTKHAFELLGFKHIKSLYLEEYTTILLQKL